MLGTSWTMPVYVELKHRSGAIFTLPSTKATLNTINVINNSNTRKININSDNRPLYSKQDIQYMRSQENQVIMILDLRCPTVTRKVFFRSTTSSRYVLRNCD